MPADGLRVCAAAIPRSMCGLQRAKGLATRSASRIHTIPLSTAAFV